MTNPPPLTWQRAGSLADGPRPLWGALLRGWRGRCPRCGEGRMFARFLKVSEACAACGEELHHHRADDAPPYFVILITGHIVVPIALAVETTFSPPYGLQMALWLPLTLMMSLGLLTPVKGAIVALQWAFRMHGFGGPNSQNDLPPPITSVHSRP